MMKKAIISALVCFSVVVAAQKLPVKKKDPVKKKEATPMVLSVVVHDNGVNLDKPMFEDFIGSNLYQYGYDLIKGYKVYSKAPQPVNLGYLDSAKADYALSVYTESVPQFHNGPGVLVNTSLYFNLINIKTKAVLAKDSLVIEGIKSGSVPSAIDISLERSKQQIQPIINRMNKVLNKAQKS